jgi:hypothetical protein
MELKDVLIDEAKDNLEVCATTKDVLVLLEQWYLFADLLVGVKKRTERLCVVTRSLYRNTSAPVHLHAGN